MNDPHVVALIYRVAHGKSVRYENAAPLVYDTPDFAVRVENEEARFEMKEHYPTPDAAREVVEPFIRRWEFHTIVDRGPGEFELYFVKGDIVDRNPAPGHHVALEPAKLKITGYAAELLLRRQYPKPSDEFGVNAAVEVLTLRYARYREDRGTLPDMAYFSLTVLADAAGDKSIRERFGIAASVTGTLGRLTGQKGGLEARKANGLADAYTPAERAWLEEAVKRLIQRAAQVAHDASAARVQITLADLPDLGEGQAVRTTGPK